MAEANRTVSFTLFMRDSFSAALGKATSGLGGLANAGLRVRQSFASLPGTLASVTAGFLSIAAVRRGVSLAEGDVQAEQRLATALKGNNVLLQQRLAAAQKIQERTTFQAGDVTEAEALLRTFGVSDRVIDQAMEAVIQRAAALRTSLEQQVHELGAAFTTGHLQRDLKQREPELAHLSETALKSGQHFAILTEKYKGWAEAVAATDFGKAKQEHNKLNDQLVRLGVLAEHVAVQVLPHLTAAVTKLVDRLDSPGGRAFLDKVGQVLAFLVDHAEQIIGVLLAVRGIGTLAEVVVSLKAIGPLVVGIVQAVFSVPVIVAALAIDIGIIIATLRDGRNYWKELPKIFGDLFDRIRDGSINFKEFFVELGRSAKLEFQIIGLQAKAYLFDLPLQLGKNLRDASLILLAGGGLQFEDPRKQIQADLDAAIDRVKEQARLEQQAATNRLSTVRQEQAEQDKINKVQQERAKTEKQVDDLLVARIDLQKKLGAAEAALPLVSEKDQIAGSIAALEASYNRREILLRTYLTRREALEIESQRAEIERLKTQIDAERSLREANLREERTSAPNAKLTASINQSLTEEIGLTGRIRELEGEIVVIQDKQLAQRTELLYKQEQERKALVEELNVRRARLGGTEIAEQQAAILELQNRQAAEMVKARQILNDSEIEDLRQIQAQELFAAEIAPIQDRLVGSISPALSQLIQGATTFKQFWTDALKSIGAALADYAARLLTTIAIQKALQGVAGLFGGGDFAGGVSTAGGNFAQGGAVGSPVPAMVAPREFVFGPIAALRLGRTVMDAINSRKLPQAVMRRLAGLFRGGAASRSWQVPGSGPDLDTVPATLPSGAYVVRRSASDYYGAGWLHALAASHVPPAVLGTVVAALAGPSWPSGAVGRTLGLLGLFPGPGGAFPYKFATGGTVFAAGASPISTASPEFFGGSSSSLDMSAAGAAAALARTQATTQQQAGGIRPTVAMVVADHQTADRILKGGDNALIEAAGRNRNQLRNVLGIG